MNVYDPNLPRQKKNIRYRKFERGGRLSNERSVTMIVVIVNRNTYYNKPVISQGYKMCQL